MTADEHLLHFGLSPADDALPAIRAVLQAETEKEAQGRGSEREDDLALLCCVQLFLKARPDDILRIWKAKIAGYDLGCAIDMHLLCGISLRETRDYLRRSANPLAGDALTYVEQCEAAGDFDGFLPERIAEAYVSYFDVR